jgi:hypothetical protein
MSVSISRQPIHNRYGLLKIRALTWTKDNDIIWLFDKRPQRIG